MFREILDAKKRVSAAFTPTTAIDNKRSVSKRGLATPKREKEYLPPRKSARLAGGQVTYLLCDNFVELLIPYFLIHWRVFAVVRI